MLLFFALITASILKKKKLGTFQFADDQPMGLKTCRHFELEAT